MSYDIYVHREGISSDDLYSGFDDLNDFSDPHHEISYYINYTYNLGRFLSDFGVHPMRNLDGKTGEEAFSMISHALSKIGEYVAVYGIDELRRNYNPPIDPSTGRPWGSVDGAVRMLMTLQKVCWNNPDYVISERS